MALGAPLSIGAKNKKQKEEGATAGALKAAERQVAFPLPIGFYPVSPALGGRRGVGGEDKEGAWREEGEQRDGANAAAPSAAGMVMTGTESKQAKLAIQALWAIQTI
jgi:hypothetical protein